MDLCLLWILSTDMCICMAISAGDLRLRPSSTRSSSYVNRSSSSLANLRAANRRNGSPPKDHTSFCAPVSLFSLSCSSALTTKPGIGTPRIPKFSSTLMPSVATIYRIMPVRNIAA